MAVMPDRQEIFKRFAACYAAPKLVELARILGVTPKLLDHWKSGRAPIPWKKLKTLVHEQDLSWDWLIEGKVPKHHHRAAKEPGQPFDRHDINQRFLSLFPDVSNAKLGKELGVRDTTVFKWRHDMEQVAWERLKYAVETKGVTWEWLIEGGNFTIIDSPA